LQCAFDVISNRSRLGSIIGECTHVQTTSSLLLLNLLYEFLLAILSAVIKG
jgi:hypothetical protein